MGKFKVKYLEARKQKNHTLYYWVPKKKYRVEGGFIIINLGRSLEEAVVKAQELNKGLDDWRKGLRVNHIPKKGTTNWLIEEYRKDEAFLNLSQKSKLDYENQIGRIKAIFGDINASKITRQHARQFYHRFSAHRRQAQYAIQVARIIFRFGKDIGIIQENPFEKMGIKSNPPRSQVWTDNEVDTFISKARELNRNSIAIAVALGASTGQRQGDILSLAWSQYNGSSIVLRQKKTGTNTYIPCLSSLKMMLDRTPITSALIVTEENTCMAYNGDHFSRKFREICNRAGIRKDLQFLDLRRTAVVRLAEAGCTIPEIAAITGHKIDFCQKIVDTYLPKTKKLAEHAIVKLEKFKGLSYESK